MRKFIQLEPLSQCDETRDPLFQTRVLRRVGCITYPGRVENIEVEKVSRNRIYLIRYDDGDEDHVPEEEVIENRVKKYSFLAKEFWI